MLCRSSVPDGLICFPSTSCRVVIYTLILHIIIDNNSGTLPNMLLLVNQTQITSPPISPRMHATPKTYRRSLVNFKVPDGGSGGQNNNQQLLIRGQTNQGTPKHHAFVSKPTEVKSTLISPRMYGWPNLTWGVSSI
jgi:hypothetical protein